MCVCLSVCVFTEGSDKRILNCGEYDIGWDYDVSDDHCIGNIHVNGAHVYWQCQSP